MRSGPDIIWVMTAVLVVGTLFTTVAQALM